jgi:acetyl esterase/lipase
MRTLCILLLAWSFACAQETTRVRDVIYQKRDGFTLTLDVFKPAKPNGAAIIKIISGGWNSTHTGIDDGAWPQYGYTTFVVVHGSQPRFHIDEIVPDVQRAVRYIRSHASLYGIDPNKIGVTGSSAGGHLALMLAVKGDAGNPKAADGINRASSAVQAVACFYPPTDFIHWKAENDGLNGVGPLATRKPAFGPKIDSPAGLAAMGKAVSPINFVAKTQPPIFIVQGDQDDLVPFTQALRFQQRTAEAGATCEVVIRQGAKHGGWAEMGEDSQRMLEWFNLHLLGLPPPKPFANGVTRLPATYHQQKNR